MCNQNDRPYQDHPTHVLGDWQALYQQIRWNRPKEVAKVEDCCDPGVALALKTEIRD